MLHVDASVANKDFKKLSIELYDSLLKLYEKGECEIVQQKILARCLIAAFNPDVRNALITYKIPLMISQVFTVDNNHPSQDWMDTFNEWLFAIPDLYNLKKRDSHIQKITKQLNQMITDKGTLIQVEGDKVIQIGTVFQRYGETTPFKRHILVLGETEKSTMNPYLKQETPTYQKKDKASRDKRDIIKTLQSVMILW